jgi:hypothetical protein
MGVAAIRPLLRVSREPKTRLAGQMRRGNRAFCMTLHDAKHYKNLLFLSFPGVWQDAEKRTFSLVFYL